RWYAAAGAALIAALVLAGVLTRAPAGANEKERSVAVLPFTSASGTLDDAAFGEGLTDELVGALSKVPGLKVAARSTAAALKRQNLSLRTIGETLGVATVLEGGVRRDGERLRVTANLVSARDTRVVWSENYDVPARDLFAVQERIARDVVGALAPPL